MWQKILTLNAQGIDMILGIIHIIYSTKPMNIKQVL